MKCLLEWDVTAVVPAVKEVTESMKVRDLGTRSALEMSPFLTSETLTLPQLEAEQIIHVFKAFLALHAFALRNSRI